MCGIMYPKIATHHEKENPMAQVLNHDVSGMLRRMDRFMFELVKSVSSSLHQTNAFDQARLTQYIGAMRSYRNWVVAQPQLDLPETSPRLIEVAEEPAIPELENESLYDVVTMLSIARSELINSQSARQSSGFVSFDDNRVMAIVDKVERLLIDYIQVTTPLDLPESSPLNAVTGSGRTGV